MATRFYKFARGLVKPFIWGLYRVKTFGTENLEYEGRMILASNHITLWDTVFIGCAHKKQIRPMAKKELFDSKFGNMLFSALGAFPVDRGKGDIGAIHAAGSVLQEEGSLIIFPEGTRNHSKEWGLMEFLNGASLIAMRNKAPILPICIANVPRLFRKTYMVFGKPIHLEDVMEPSASRSENTRRLTAVVKARIQQMHDEMMEKIKR